MIIYIKPNSLFTNPARWFVQFLARHLQVSLNITDKYTEGVLKITDEADSDVVLSTHFYQNLEKRLYVTSSFSRKSL